MAHTDGTPTKYEELAARYARAIESGTLRAGDRLPSVRALHERERVSIATVMQALARLESLGLVEARSRSGYFVRSAAKLAAPETTAPGRRPRPVNVGSLVRQFYASVRDPALVPLGAATPSAELMPARALARATAAALRERPKEAVDYEMPPGSERLRVAVARRSLSWGCALDADDLVVTSGATEAIHLALMAVASRGDVVAVESPTFYTTLQAIEAHGLRALEIPCHPEHGMDVDALEVRLSQQRVAAVLVVSNFSNPLGSRMPDAAKRRLVALLRQRDVPLIEDDVYGDLSFEPGRPRVAKSYDAAGGVLLCGSLSKTAAPGYRVGWIAPGAHRARVEQLKYGLNVATASLMQEAIAHYLESGAHDRHLRALRPRIAANVANMAAAVGAAFPSGTRVSRPRGGYVLWVELPARVDALELHRRALEAGVAIAPGPLFSPGGQFRHHVRLSCAQPWTDRIRGGVELVGRLARRLAERDPPAGAARGTVTPR